MKIIWWLIQINAVLCFLLVGKILQSDVDNSVKILAGVVLFVVALLEYFAYYRLYKPIK